MTNEEEKHDEVRKSANPKHTRSPDYEAPRLKIRGIGTAPAIRIDSTHPTNWEFTHRTLTFA